MLEIKELEGVAWAVSEADGHPMSPKAKWQERVGAPDEAWCEVLKNIQKQSEAPKSTFFTYFCNGKAQ